MTITLNGKEKTLDAPSYTVAEIIESTGQKPERVAIQLNGTIIKRDSYSTQKVQDGDVMEMLQFVGGG